MIEALLGHISNVYDLASVTFAVFFPDIESCLCLLRLYVDYFALSLLVNLIIKSLTKTVDAITAVKRTSRILKGVVLNIIPP